MGAFHHCVSRSLYLRAREVQGVHICGELLDVFGRIGGYNFYWAWVTGRLAGVAAGAAAVAARRAGR